ncbi:MAG: hypothetical protein WC528_04160 [Patescibacteria group bacterium]
METQPIYKYIWFGTCLRFLQDVTSNTKIHGDGLVLANINGFLEYLDILGLIVTKRASAKLVQFKKEIENLPTHSNLTVDQAVKLRGLMDSIRNTLSAEAEGVLIFVVTSKRLDVNKLLNEVSNLFAPDVFKNLPDVARFDFNEAGKCIAFYRPTAAAFHLLRGTEAMLREFYCRLIKQKRLKELLWGPVVDNLRLRQKTKKYDTLYNNLDNIRLSFRNPTQHPEKVYDIDEAQDLWSLCIDVVNRMSKILMENS